mmetsp:Transcript_29146/g.35518  ORF Transcript_29146/g.35518 Transcript_29146/m.35518 type:complete len:149 (-) Transcript_29146:54-500(-)|eukprot:CAMPEP_0172503706 /NCGR_PEP_ID=MMETSP1066-20121228/171468_1 /TAXON_ID=671091 /ORGANISM="Coscinodiscus wailesii, Strain CCMP2513" /LENGTH=148 /DNA_ID=CAMNT_0013279543 /DNA_START=101 /DNA_END=547 /DNA_ORIENTATION=+
MPPHVKSFERDGEQDRASSVSIETLKTENCKLRNQISSMTRERFVDNYESTSDESIARSIRRLKAENCFLREDLYGMTALCQEKEKRISALTKRADMLADKLYNGVERSRFDGVEFSTSTDDVKTKGRYFCGMNDSLLGYFRERWQGP